MNEKPQKPDESGKAGVEAALITALFVDRAQADVAISDLERSGFSSNQVGIAYRPGNDEAGSGGKEKLLIPGTPTTGFPGWTMGMAPWAITGVGPLIVQGALSLSPPRERPDDLKGLAANLGLREGATEELEAGLIRNHFLMTVKAPEKETIATHILERNGGRILPRK